VGDPAAGLRAAGRCCGSPVAGWPRFRGPSWLLALDGRGRQQQGHVVAHEQATARKRLVPLEAELAAVDDGRHLEAHALVAPRVGAGASVVALELDRLRHALQRDLARNAGRAVAGQPDRLRAELDLRNALSIQEVRRAVL